jgi:hypothetical protein
LQYAITRYGLAAVLIVMLLFWMRTHSARRCVVGASVIRHGAAGYAADLAEARSPLS